MMRDPACLRGACSGHPVPASKARCLRAQLPARLLRLGRARRKGCLQLLLLSSRNKLTLYLNTAHLKQLVWHHQWERRLRLQLLRGHLPRLLMSCGCHSQAQLGKLLVKHSRHSKAGLCRLSPQSMALHPLGQSLGQQVPAVREMLALA